MENKSMMKSRLSGGSETTTHVDVEKFLRSIKVMRPTSIENKTSSKKMLWKEYRSVILEKVVSCT
jgi:hypothetical protein